VTVVAGWYADPTSRHQYRFWDGTTWTDAVGDNGVQGFDPLVPVAPPSGKRWPPGVKIAVAVAVTIVLVAVGVGVVGMATHKSKNDNVAGGVQPTPDELLNDITSIPASVYDKVGEGSADALPRKLPGPLLKAADGKPRVVYIGALYCPFCATERWAMVAALSRFGTFSNLGISESAATPEVYPQTRTFSFHGSTYTSKYLTFEPVETETNTEEPLDVPTPEQQALQQTFDAPPYASGGDAIPFIDFANEFVVSGSTYSPAVLQHQSYSQIAAAMRDPDTDISQGAIGAANGLTAAICEVTANQPANVCTSSAIVAIEGQLR
jgi:hypothetical protein